MAHQKLCKSHQVAKTLRSELYSSPPEPGAEVASANEVAIRFHITQKTAHKAINLLVGEGLLIRENGRGTFFRGEGRSDKLQIGIADQTIGLPLSSGVNRMLDSHFDIASDYFRGQNCDVRMISYSELRKNPHALTGLDGLLISALYLDKDTALLLRNSRLPIVVYRYSHKDPYAFSRLCFDLDSGIREALAYLKPPLDQRVILVYDTTPHGQLMRDRWLDNLRQYGMDLSRIQDCPIDPRERSISCYRLVRVNSGLFRNALILACDDEYAGNLYSALTLENFRCGRDCLLIGGGNWEAYGSFSVVQEPVLASIDLPIRLMSEEGAKLLLYKIRNHSECNHIIWIPTCFVPRASCGKFIQSTFQESIGKDHKHEL